MASSSHSVSGQNGVQFGPDPALVREQLRRLVAHPLFTNSKRYPVLLTYTVEQTLLGNASELKERTIGIEAFGRKPVYDVNLDPVVRTAAAEVRKRLSQYYYNPDHAGELVIELPIGSYVPTFREPVGSQMGFGGGAFSRRESGVASEGFCFPIAHGRKGRTGAFTTRDPPLDSDCHRIARRCADRI